VLIAFAVCWCGWLCWYDCRERRLPNWLTLTGAAAALVWRWGYGGTPWILNGAVGAVVAGLFLLIPFLMHAAGGGDVKMLFGAGAIVG